MKQFLRTTTLALLGLLFAVQSFAGGKDFSGVIVYNITYPDSKLDAQTMAMMPTTMKMTVRENMSKIDISMSMGSTVIIFDADTKTGTTLMDMMGQKFAIAMDAESMEEESDDIDSINVVVTGETKEIAGYNCKKAVINYLQKGKPMESVVWYTDELDGTASNASNPLYKDIDGVLLEFTSNDSGIEMKMEAVSVDKKKVSKKEFEIPEGYKEVTPEELQNMFGGGGY